jgi:hypothetical protein
MVLCDAIERAPGEDDVFNLIGVRTQIRAGSFPYSHPQLCIYLQVTGHQGTAACHVEVVPAGGDSAVFSSPEQDVQFEGPLVVVPVVWLIERCSFPEAGLYYVQVYFGQRLACERLLILSEGTVISNGEEPA